MRRVLPHAIDLDIVWGVVEQELPKLSRAIGELLSDSPL